METQVQRLVDKAWGLFASHTGHCRQVLYSTDTCTHPSQSARNSPITTLPDRRRRHTRLRSEAPWTKRPAKLHAHLQRRAGKTTLAAKVADAIDARYRAASPGLSLGTTHPIAAFIPMDGFHLTRAELSAMPDPTTAHARRGAAFTFDGAAYLALVKALREPITPEMRTLYAPSFDHAVKDPVENDIAISPSARVVVLEGNYVALNREPWKDAAALLDEVWFVEVKEDVARRRLVDRHVAAGIAGSAEEARRRVDENDLVNGQEIVENMVKVDEVVHSIEDDAWTMVSQGLDRPNNT